MIDETLLKVDTFDGIGYQPVVDFESWRVAYLRYHPELLPENITHMQRHEKTDEVFVLLEGHCILLIGEGKDKVETIHAVDMQPYQIYNVKKGCWHSHTLSRDARVLIVENRETSDINSPKSKLSQQHCDLIINETRSLWKVSQNT
jgi:ureidoglycolate hydrolase